MDKPRKLTATFSDGAVMTRTTKTPSLTCAWRCRGANYWKTDGTWHEWTAEGFASDPKKARRAAQSRGVSPKRIETLEIVVCEVVQ